MFSADLMVDDTVKTADVLVERLGLPRWRPTWTDSTPDHLLYLRARHPFSQAAPTLVEIIRPSAALAATSGQPSDRPVRTHATVFVTKSFREVVANLDNKGLRYWEMPDPGDGLARVFTGVANFEVGTPGNQYDGAVDGNLFMEIISWEGTVLALRDPIPPELSAGTITRVVSRSYLIPDIDQTLHQLHEIFTWDQASQPASENAEDRFATLQPLMQTSAALELIQPKATTGRHGEFFARWGVGPHAIRFGVHGLETKAEDLRQRGTGFTESQTPSGVPILLVDESVVDGIIVEFIEDPLYADTP
jgi:hypothetical protein